MYLQQKGQTLQKTFNPDNFFNITKIKDIEEKLEHLKNHDFTKSSLNKELTKINYEVTSSMYSDFMYKTLEEYFEFEVDTIV